MTPELIERIFKLFEADAKTRPIGLSYDLEHGVWRYTDWGITAIVDYVLIGHWSFWLDKRNPCVWREEVDHLVYMDGVPLLEAMLIQVEKNVFQESGAEDE